MRLSLDCVRRAFNSDQSLTELSRARLKFNQTQSFILTILMTLIVSSSGVRRRVIDWNAWRAICFLSTGTRALCERAHAARPSGACKLIWMNRAACAPQGNHTRTRALAVIILTSSARYGANDFIDAIVGIRECTNPALYEIQVNGSQNAH